MAKKIEPIKTSKVKYDELGEVVFPLRQDVTLDDRTYGRVLEFNNRKLRIKGVYHIYSDLWENSVSVSLGVRFFVDTRLITRIIDYETMKSKDKKIAVQKILELLSLLKKNKYVRKTKGKLEKIIRDINVNIERWYDVKKDEFGEKMYIYEVDVQLERESMYFNVYVSLEIHKYVTEVSLYFRESIKDRNLAKFSFKKIRKPFILPQEFLALFWSLDRYIMRKSDQTDDPSILTGWLFSPPLRSVNKRNKGKKA